MKCTQFCITDGFYHEIMIQNINKNTLFDFIYKKKQDKIDEMDNL